MVRSHTQRDSRDPREASNLKSNAATIAADGIDALRRCRPLATLVIAVAVLILGCATPPAPSPVRHSGVASVTPAPEPAANAADVEVDEPEPQQSKPAPANPWRKWSLAADVKPRDWRYIVVHHSASDAGSAAAFDRHHREVNGWDGLGYHFVIGNGNGSADGLIEIGFRWPIQREGAHAGSTEHNQHGVGICLVGNFDKDQPTTAQMDALVDLSADLLARFGIPFDNVIRHCDCKKGGITHCPGQTFPWFDYQRQLRRAVYTNASAAANASAGGETNTSAELDLLMPQ